MSLAEAHRSLARTLPVRLQKFFVLNAPRTSVAFPSVPVHEPAQIPESSTAETPSPISRRPRQAYNPFTPHKDPTTGRWHPPIYSLRRQAELVKLAKQHGVEELLPDTPKKSSEKVRRREEQGLRVRGTGVGQRVKGHERERSLQGKLEIRRQAMLEMPKMIQLWKQRGHGRGWTKWPK